MAHDIIGIVKHLVQLFLTVQGEQKRLRREELSEFSTSESIPILKTVATAQDKDFKNVISEAFPPVIIRSSGRTPVPRSSDIRMGGITIINNNSEIGQVIGEVHIHGDQPSLSEGAPAIAGQCIQNALSSRLDDAEDEKPIKLHARPVAKVILMVYS